MNESPAVHRSENWQPMTEMGHKQGLTRSGLLKKPGAPRAAHNEGFNWPAPVTDVSVNLKIDVQRVGLNLCKSGLGAAYRARV